MNKHAPPIRKPAPQGGKPLTYMDRHELASPILRSPTYAHLWSKLVDPDQVRREVADAKVEFQRVTGLDPDAVNLWDWVLNGTVRPGDGPR